MKQNSSNLDFNTLKSKIVKYCLYQERSIAEVSEKLADLGASENEKQQLLAWLQTENYLNQNRFAYQFAHGKFTLKDWGRHKIRHALRSHQLSTDEIEQALQEALPPDTYLATLKRLIEFKSKTLKGLSPIQKKQKLTAYLLQKGFSWEEIMDAQSVD